jgi:hypothetical protein
MLPAPTMSARKELSDAIDTPWLRAAMVLAVLATVVIAALGGFRKATAGTGASQVPDFAAGVPLDTGAMQVTALQAWRSLQDPDGISDPGNPQQYLVLRVRVDNRSGKTTSTYGHLQEDLVWLPGEREGDGEGEGLVEVKADRFLRADDHTLADVLHPGMPTEIDMVWKLPPGKALPAKLQWGVSAREFSPKATFFGASGWIQGRPLAKLVLPVEDRRDRVIAP